MSPAEKQPALLAAALVHIGWSEDGERVLSRRRALPVCRGFGWGVLAALAAASVLLFPLALLVVPVCGACALLLNRCRSTQAELVGIWLGLAAFCGAYAVGNAFRPECPPSGVRQVGFENRSCFDSVLFRVEPWAVTALVLLAAAAWHWTSTSKPHRAVRQR